MRSSTTAAAVDPETLARCLAVLAHLPSAVITDIDGTISAIAPTPDEALVTLVAREALTALADRLALVGVVTGRSAAVGAAMVAVPGLVYIGNHGMERVHKGVVWHHPGALAKADAIGAALREIGADVAAEAWVDGVVIEDKRLSGSVHYRLVPDSVPARDVLLRLANEAADRYDLVVTEGRQIVELRPRVVVNKGTAIRALVEEFGLGGLIFLGDDLTDVDAFREVRTLREEGRVEGLRVAVLAAETQPEVFAESDVTVNGVGACVALVAAIAGAVGAADGDDER